MKMHLHRHGYFNETINNAPYSESFVLQEIRKVQYEESNQQHTEDPVYMKWFFGMNRENGGFARFSCWGIRLPLSLDITYLAWIIAFLVPVIAFCLIIPALRKKAFASFIVVIIFSSSGLALITGLLTTSWLVGEVEGKMTMGPLETRCNVRVGMWVGLSTINITLEKKQMYLNERVSIDDIFILKGDQKKAMLAGWPWPILLVIEYLAGEGNHWAGTLGFYLNRAGRSVYVVLYFSVLLWIVWMFCFTIALHLACKPLILSGILELSSALFYAAQFYVYIVPYIIIEGNKLSLTLGWSWWFTVFLGCLHIFCGVILFAYEYFRPGKLSTIFEVDFGLPTHRLNIKKLCDDLNNELPFDNSDDDFDDFESNSYKSFHEPNSLEPSPKSGLGSRESGLGSSDLSLFKQSLETNNNSYSPDTTEGLMCNKSFCYTLNNAKEGIVNNNCSTPLSEDKMAKSCLHKEADFSIDTNKIDCKKRNVFPESKSSLHEIYVH